MKQCINNKIIANNLPAENKEKEKKKQSPKDPHPLDQTGDISVIFSCFCQKQHGMLFLFLFHPPNLCFESRIDR